MTYKQISCRFFKPIFIKSNIFFKHHLESYRLTYEQTATSSLLKKCLDDQSNFDDEEDEDEDGNDDDCDDDNAVCVQRQVAGGFLMR